MLMVPLGVVIMRDCVGPLIIKAGLIANTVQTWYAHTQILSFPLCIR